MAKNLIVLLKVEFLPKFSVRGVWQRWRESYPTDGSKAEDAITVFTGVSVILISIVHVSDMVHSHGTLVCVYNLSLAENNYVYCYNHTKTAFIVHMMAIKLIEASGITTKISTTHTNCSEEFRSHF